MEHPFFDAVKAGNVAEVTRLVREQPVLGSARDANGASAILVAIYNRQPAVAATLVELGVPVDIFEASALGQVDRISALLKEDPSRVSAYAADGFYPVGLAAFFGHLDAVRALIGPAPHAARQATPAIRIPVGVLRHFDDHLAD